MVINTYTVAVEYLCPKKESRIIIIFCFRRTEVILALLLGIICFVYLLRRFKTANQKKFVLCVFIFQSLTQRICKIKTLEFILTGVQTNMRIIRILKCARLPRFQRCLGSHWNNLRISGARNF